MFGILENLDKCREWWTPTFNVPYPRLPIRKAARRRANHPPRDGCRGTSNLQESAGMCNKAVRDLPSGVRAASKVESFFCKARSYVPNVENFAAAISLLDPCAPSRLPTFRNLSLSLPFPSSLWVRALFSTHFESARRADKEFGSLSLRQIHDKFARYFRALRWTRISFYGAADFIVRQNCPGRSFVNVLDVMCATDFQSTAWYRTREESPRVSYHQWSPILIGILINQYPVLIILSRSLINNLLTFTDFILELEMMEEIIFRTFYD